MFIRGSDFCFTKQEVAALLAHASKDQTRSHIWGVGVFPSKGTAVATDGHRLAALTSQDGEVADEGANYIVPRDALATAAKACPAKGCIAVINGRINVYADATGVEKDGLELATLAFVGPESVFPPWEQIVPPMHRPGTVPALGINAAYVATLATVARACTSPECVMHLPDDTLHPVLVVMGEWRVIIMPCRSSGAVSNPKKAA